MPENYRTHRSLPKELLGKKERVTKKEAALRQIEAGMKLFNDGNLVPAITLALAAEDQLPDSAAPYLWKQLKGKTPKYILGEFNTVRNWLKHNQPPDEIVLFEFEAVIALARATSKFVAVYGQGSAKIEAFIRWARDRGYLRSRG